MLCLIHARDKACVKRVLKVVQGKNRRNCTSWFAGQWKETPNVNEALTCYESCGGWCVEDDQKTNEIGTKTCSVSGSACSNDADCTCSAAPITSETCMGARREAVRRHDAEPAAEGWILRRRSERLLRERERIHRALQRETGRGRETRLHCRGPPEPLCSQTCDLNVAPACKYFSHTENFRRYCDASGDDSQECMMSRLSTYVVPGRRIYMPSFGKPGHMRTLKQAEEELTNHNIFDKPESAFAKGSDALKGTNTATGNKEYVGPYRDLMTRLHDDSFKSEWTGGKYQTTCTKIPWAAGWASRPNSTQRSIGAPAQDGDMNPANNGVFFPQLFWNHKFPTDNSALRNIDTEVDRATVWTTTTADAQQGEYLHNMERCGKSKEATLNSHVRQWCERRLEDRILSIPFEFRDVYLPQQTHNCATKPTKSECNDYADKKGVAFVDESGKGRCTATSSPLAFRSTPLAERCPSTKQSRSAKALENGFQAATNSCLN